MNEFGHQSSPSGLVRGSKSFTGITIEIFVEQNVVFEMWISLKFLISGIDRAFPIFIFHENFHEPQTNFAGHLQ